MFVDGHDVCHDNGHDVWCSLMVTVTVTMFDGHDDDGGDDNDGDDNDGDDVWCSMMMITVTVTTTTTTTTVRSTFLLKTPLSKLKIHFINKCDECEPNEETEQNNEHANGYVNTVNKFKELQRLHVKHNYRRRKTK